MKRLKGFVLKIGDQFIKNKNILTYINKTPKIWDNVKAAEKYIAAHKIVAEIMHLADCAIFGYAIDDGDTEIREILCWKPEYTTRGLMIKMKVTKELIPLHPHEYRRCYASKKLALESMIGYQKDLITLTTSRIKKEKDAISKVEIIIKLLEARLQNDKKRTKK